MNIPNRKKAVSKLVKLLNLATSNNSSEAQMAIRHAESLIRQHNITRMEITTSKLCDPKMLDQVSWNGQGKVFTSMFYHSSINTSDDSLRRFSEKNSYNSNTNFVDPNEAYADAKTILDDDFEIEEQEDPFKQAVKSQTAKKEEAEKQREELKKAQEEFDKQQEEQAAREAEVKKELEKELEQVQRESEASIAKELDEEFGEPVAEVNEEQTLDEAATNLKESQVFESRKPESVKAKMDASFDNVINAANAFRPEGYTNQFRDQYASSDPSIPFEEDPYWQKVYSQLLDFDEFQVQITIDKIECEMSLAQEALENKKQLRRNAEQEELNERSERARIELSFEEAIERAFQARAEAYQEWERKRAGIRADHLNAEQEASNAYNELALDLQKQQEDFQLHLKRKQDYQAAKVMHDLRSHLAQAVNVSDEGQSSYDKVVSIMTESGLSLKDLEFSDIKNKSLFIRLLERETANIDDVVARERHTEDMLSKFLSSSMTQRDSVKAENPLQLVEKLLTSASNSSQFEARKSLEQVFHIMSSNGISIRDIDLAKITKYSVFVRLLNWEAEQIKSINERESFTASILEEYVKSSIGNENKADSMQHKNKA